MIKTNKIKQSNNSNAQSKNSNALPTMDVLEESTISTISQKVEPSPEECIKIIEDPKIIEYVKVAAVRRIAELNYTPAIPDLLRWLSPHKPELALEILRTLGKFKASEAVPVICRLFESRVDVIRWTAADALGEIGDDSAVYSLVEVLRDRSWGVRSSAARALGKIFNNQKAHTARWFGTAITALCGALKDEESGVRLCAAWAIGESGTKEGNVWAALRAAKASEKDALVREYIEEAIRKLESY